MIGSIAFIRSDLVFVLIDALIVSNIILLYSKNARPMPLTATLMALIVSKAIIFIGLRPTNAGFDTYNYFFTFQLLDSIGDARNVGLSYYGNSEILFWPYAAVFKKIVSEDFTIFLTINIVFSLLIIFFSFEVLAKSTPMRRYFSKSSSQYGAIFLGLVFMSFNIVFFGNHLRASLAVPTALLALSVSTTGRTLFAACLCAVSIGLHNSAASIAPLIVGEAILGQRTFSERSLKSAGLVALGLSILAGAILQDLSFIIEDMGDSISEKYDRYAQRENLNASIFESRIFWVISLHTTAFFFLRFTKQHLYVVYFLSLVFLFSGTPKVSERFFGFILLLLPMLTYVSIRPALKESTAIIGLAVYSAALGVFVITSYGARETLSIASFF